MRCEIKINNRQSTIKITITPGLIFITKIDSFHHKNTIGYTLLIRMNDSILPFKILWAKYRNNGRQDITATLNGTVNGGKTYFNQSSQELIPNGSTVTEKGRIRDRSWSARRGQTPR